MAAWPTHKRKATNKRPNRHQVVVQLQKDARDEIRHPPVMWACARRCLLESQNGGFAGERDGHTSPKGERPTSCCRSERELVWSTPKSYERRSVPFPRFLADDLAALMVGKQRDDLVFTARKGGVLRLSHFRPQVFGPAVERLVASGSEFPRVTPHDLRHMAASLAISGGANPKAVQTMLGHQSAALTLDTYTDLFPDDLELVSAALDQARQAALDVTADQLRTGTQQRL